MTKPRDSSVPMTPVAVGRLMPTAAANSRASISPHTHSTQSPTNEVQLRRSGASTFASMCRLIAAELRNRFEIAHIARKSSGRCPSSSRTLRSAGSRPSSPGRCRSPGRASDSRFAPSRSRRALLPSRAARRARARRRAARHVVLGRAEVHEARPEPHLVVDQRATTGTRARRPGSRSRAPGCGR